MPVSLTSRIAAWLLVLTLTCFGGCTAGAVFREAQSTSTIDSGPCPLPYHVPKFPGAATLRFAMVHDVVTERYPKHGRAYYEERNRITRLAMQDEERRMGETPSRIYFALTDDLAAGLDHLGRHTESISLMRDKLKRQLALGQKGIELYTTYANLGTFIILAEIHEGFVDKNKARAGLTEGVELILKAIAINPRSHFGREIWQAVILEYLLLMLDDPEIVLKLDMVGNQFGETPFYNGTKWGDRFSKRSWGDDCREARDYLLKPESGQEEGVLKGFRNRIATLTPHFPDKARISHHKEVPFDEPTLGIIGMWRLGGGPNPFFAVALGEIMIRTGQNYNAWNAFERAYLLGDAVGPPPISQKFKDHCRARQKSIEEELLPESERPQLRPSFEIELAKGLAYQKAYLDYEARHIQEGAPIDDPHFYDAFEAEYGSIASPVGDEDRFLPEDYPRIRQFSIGMMCLGTGIGAMLGALLIRLWDFGKRKMLGRN